MASQPTRVQRNLKANTGRLIRIEQLVGRLEKRIERLEKQNAQLRADLLESKAARGPRGIERLEKQAKAEMAKLRVRVDQAARDNKQNAAAIDRMMALGGPVQALVKSFKQTPGAPFTTWRMWMLATFRKQGVYRRQMFK